jgi:aspartate/methionine/tyrosine aminotransferase
MSDETKQGMGNYARFAFCKKDETLQQACEKLLKLKQFQKHK